MSTLEPGHEEGGHFNSSHLAKLDEYKAAEKRLVRKVDFIILPILSFTLVLQYYDKAVIGSAAVLGLIEDLGLSQTINGVTYTTRYSTANAAFNFGYIVAVLPMSLLFARLPLAKSAGVIIAIWGVVCMLTVVCHDYPGFVAQRVALGLMESAVLPAFVAVTALWYKPSEQASRLGIWYAAYGYASMISGIINYGLGHNSLASPWKALYYFGGSITIAWAFFIYFFMPTSPLEPGRFFNEDERMILRKRFAENPFGKDRMKLKWDQVIEALLDFKTYIYLLMAAAIYICNGSVTVFGARIIKSWGYDSLTTIALLIPGGAMTAVTIYLFCYINDKWHNSRTYVLPLSCVPVWIGALVCWLAPWHPTAGPLIGYYLIASFGAPYVMLLSLTAGNTAGATKKAVTTGATFVGYNAGNIASSYLVLTQEKPIKYRTTWVSVIVAMFVASVLSLVLRAWYIRENKRRDTLPPLPSATTSSNRVDVRDGQEIEKALPAQGGVTGEVSALIDDSIGRYEDLTDKQRPEFRYVY